jgi:fructosamine-3-kinase
VTRQPLVARRAEELLGAAVVATAPVAGGAVATSTRLRLSDGTTALMKTLPHAPPDLFPTEAAGLRWLAAATPAGGAHVPDVLAADAECLIIRWVEPGKSSTDSAVALGRALATTHAAGAPAYGRPADGYVGRLPLPNGPCDTWAEFYVARRIVPYLRAAFDRGQATSEHVAAVDALLPRIPDLVPEEPPARLHGDLWNGNVVWGSDGHAWLVDPAAYGGHREMDLAMLALFGLPHLPRVIEAYAEVAPLADGWQERLGLHQLFPLLVHACMAGGGYAARAAEIARRYA